MARSTRSHKKKAGSQTGYESDESQGMTPGPSNAPSEAPDDDQDPADLEVNEQSTLVEEEQHEQEEVMVPSTSQAPVPVATNAPPAAIENVDNITVDIDQQKYDADGLLVDLELLPNAALDEVLKKFCGHAATVKEEHVKEKEEVDKLDAPVRNFCEEWTRGSSKPELYSYAGTINGEFCAVWASGVDVNLAECSRLRVPKGVHLLRKKSQAFAVAVATKMFWKSDGTCEIPPEWIICGAYAVASMGAIAVYDEGGKYYADGDWSLVTGKPTDAEVNLVSETLKDKRRLIERLCTVILATKATWWVSNHHTGGKEMTPALQNLVNASLGELMPGGNNVNMPSFVHMIGHWASTLPIMKMFGKKVRSHTRIIYRALKPVLPVELKLRISSLPAGCHKMGWCHSVFKIMLNSPIVPHITRRHELIMLRTASIIKHIQADPARYHVGAYFLTGKSREDYDDNTAPGGLCIAWAKFNITDSTLCRAPYYLTHESDGYKSLPGYDGAFAEVCQIRKNMLSNRIFRERIETDMAQKFVPKPLNSSVDEEISMILQALDDKAGPSYVKECIEALNKKIEIELGGYPDDSGPSKPKIRKVEEAPIVVPPVQAAEIVQEAPTAEATAPQSEA